MLPGYGNGRLFFCGGGSTTYSGYMVEKTHVPRIGSKFIRTKFRINLGYMDFYKPITTVLKVAHFENLPYHRYTGIPLVKILVPVKKLVKFSTPKYSKLGHFLNGP